MSVPLQVIVADPDLARDVAAGPPADGAWVFRWDDQPEVGARAARHAREILEAVGALGEGGFARLVIGGARAEVDALIVGGPAPVVSLRVGLDGDGLVVPADVGPRALAHADRVAVAGHLAGWIMDVAAGPGAREALVGIAAAVGEGALALAGCARLPVERLERQLVRRALGAVAARLHGAVQGGRTSRAGGLATRFERGGLAIDRGAADALGARVVEEGPELVRRLAARALDEADALAEAVRAEVDRVLGQEGLAGLEPARVMIAELAREVAEATPAARTIAEAPGGPARAALDAAEEAVARLDSPAPGLWPLEVAGALGGATVGALAIGPLVPALERVPGGGAGLAAAVGLGLWGLAAVATRIAQAVTRRQCARALDAARQGYAEAWRDAARAWLAPIADAAERRAHLRLARALEAERASLDAVLADLEVLRRAGQRPAAVEGESPRALAVTIDVEAAAAVLALPIEPLVARADAEVRRPDWRDGRPLLRPEGVEAAARASHAHAGWSAATGLPLAARADLTAALAGAVGAGLTALRDELARWVPEGLPARRYVSTPGPLAGAVPEGARHDERVPSRRDLWVVAMWRPA